MATARVATTIHENVPEASYGSGDPRGRHAHLRSLVARHAVNNGWSCDGTAVASPETFGVTADSPSLLKNTCPCDERRNCTKAIAPVLFLLVLRTVMVYTLADPFVTAPVLGSEYEALA